MRTIIDNNCEIIIVTYFLAGVFDPEQKKRYDQLLYNKRSGRDGLDEGETAELLELGQIEGSLDVKLQKFEIVNTSPVYDDGIRYHNTITVTSYQFDLVKQKLYELRESLKDKRVLMSTPIDDDSDLPF